MVGFHLQTRSMRTAIATGHQSNWINCKLNWEGKLVIKLVVCNQRGGVGKTTTAMALSRFLADRNMKTLLVDADPQGSVATILRLKPEYYLYDFLIRKFHLRDCVVTQTPTLDILAGGRTTMD